MSARAWDRRRRVKRLRRAGRPLFTPTGGTGYLWVPTLADPHRATLDELAGAVELTLYLDTDAFDQAIRAVVRATHARRRR